MNEQTAFDFTTLMTPVFTFDPATHTYTLDGKKIPSVTGLISIMGDNPQEFDELLDTAFGNAAERGTVLHGYLAHRFMGGDPEDYEMPAAYAGYADAVDLFIDEHEFEPVIIETPFYATEQRVTFAGTPDYYGGFDGKDAILDYKFVAQVNKAKVSAQLNGYASLLAANGVATEAMYAVQFMKDGTYRLYPVKDRPETFYLCLDVYRMANREHPRGRIE